MLFSFSTGMLILAGILTFDSLRKHHLVVKTHKEVEEQGCGFASVLAFCGKQVSFFFFSPLLKIRLKSISPDFLPSLVQLWKLIGCIPPLCCLFWPEA